MNAEKLRDRGFLLRLLLFITPLFIIGVQRSSIRVNE